MQRRKGRILRYESLEDRRMLAKADVVFLVDESRSDAQSRAQDWLRALVTGDIDNNGSKEVSDFADRLADAGISDLRYGLVGFGEETTSGTLRFAHSQLFEPGNPNSLFGNPSQMTTAQLNTVFNGLAQLGGDEDGWDAIEHAIAEYEIRPDAVPVFVLVQNDEGRIGFFPTPPESANETLTRDGLLAALKSKNVILNTLTVGEGIAFDGTTGFANEWAPAFNLAPYEVTSGAFSNLRVLGIESPIAGNGQHDYHAFNTATNTVPTTLPATESDALQVSFNGSNTEEGTKVSKEQRCKNKQEQRCQEPISAYPIRAYRPIIGS